MTMPNFLIIGAPKSGTTSLDEYLKQHPQIYMSPQKEPYFFAFENEIVDFNGPDLKGKDSIINNAVISDIKTYQSLFDDVTSEVAVGEASTLYLYFSKAPERIKYHIPDVKLIAILRNPIDRAYSAFMHAIRDNYEPITDFDRAMKAEKERIAQNWGPLWRYQDQGFYYMQLKRYFDVFNPSQIKIYLYEDLIESRSELLISVFDFLGVDKTFKPDTSTKYNVTGVPRNKLLHKFLSEPSFLKRALKSVLPKGLRREISIDLRNANLVKPELSDDLKNSLIEVYKEDILKLRKLIDRDLSHWLQ